MDERATISGEVVNYKEPVWQPLLDFAPECIDDFMWMVEVELEDGERAQAYKHYWTRRYLHLTDDGRAFVYRHPDDYREVDADWLLEAVVRPWPGREPEWHVPARN